MASVVGIKSSTLLAGSLPSRIRFILGGLFLVCLLCAWVTEGRMMVHVQLASELVVSFVKIICKALTLF